MLAAALAIASPLLQAPAAGGYRAWLDSPGGPLRFGLDLESDGERWSAWIVNGPERMPVEAVVESGGDRLTLSIPHYDAEVQAVADSQGGLHGEWRRRRSSTEWTGLPFHAEPAMSSAIREPVVDGSHEAVHLAPRWAVRFAGSEHPSVGLLQAEPGGTATGTFLNVTGDYRYLAGTWDGRHLTLSCFDGAHAFLFRAQREADGSLRGDFWSGASWHESWTAIPDEHAALPDAFGLTRWTGDPTLPAVPLLDLDGQPGTLLDPARTGRVQLVQLFGSWCPNCNDEAEYLVELQRRYGARGLDVVGLAFELTEDAARNASQVRRFLQRHGASWPVYLVGPSDKEQAGRAFPFLDRVRAYPTTLFVDRSGRVRAVHTGFSGPATGASHQQLRVEFEGRIEALLAEAPGG